MCFVCLCSFALSVYTRANTHTHSASDRIVGVGPGLLSRSRPTVTHTAHHPHATHAHAQPSTIGTSRSHMIDFQKRKLQQLSPEEKAQQRATMEDILKIQVCCLQDTRMQSQHQTNTKKSETKRNTHKTGLVVIDTQIRQLPRILQVGGQSQRSHFHTSLCSKPQQQQQAKTKTYARQELGVFVSGVSDCCVVLGCHAGQR